MTKYTDDQVNEAIMLANQTSKVYAWQTEIHRDVIECLPDQQDEWVECAFNEVKNTDLKVRVEYGSWAIEGKPYVQNDAIGIKTGEGYYARSFFYVHISDEVTLYRIPAPIIHPDPAQHPVIYVKDSDIVNFVPKIMVWYRDFYVAGLQCLSPDRVTDWQRIDPAKVIADE